MRKPKRFYVYIMTNRPFLFFSHTFLFYLHILRQKFRKPLLFYIIQPPRSHVLYTGVTGDLSRRVFEHKNKLVPGFTSRYNLTRLAYYECFFYPDAAIDREKEIKGWRRSKKICLIESMNPHWEDLAEQWSAIYKPPVSRDAREIPRPAGENAGLRDDASE